MRELNYWLRVIKGIIDGKKEELEWLINESEELKKILGSICQKTRTK